MMRTAVKLDQSCKLIDNIGLLLLFYLHNYMFYLHNYACSLLSAGIKIMVYSVRMYGVATPVVNCMPAL